jgi:hypothetical protein
VVWAAVEVALNSLLNSEANESCEAIRAVAGVNGHVGWKLQLEAGDEGRRI